MTDGCKIIFLEVSQPADGDEGILHPPPNHSSDAKSLDWDSERGHSYFEA